MKQRKLLYLLFFLVVIGTSSGIAQKNAAKPAIIPEYTQDFSEFLPTGWTQAEGVLAQPSSTLLDVGTDWMQDEFANEEGGDLSARISVRLMFIKDWLISPSIDLGDGSKSYKLEFDLALTAFNGPNQASTGGVDDKFAIVISTDNGVTWSETNALKLWDNEGSPNVFNNIATAGEKVVIDLSDYTGVVKFGFYAESLVNNVENYLFVDNFAVKEIPPITPEYTQDFSTFIPDRWTQAEGILAEPSTLLDVSTDWMQKEFANTGTDQSAKISVKLMFIKDWLISPSIDLGNGSTPHQLEFDLALTAFTGPDQASTGGIDDKFAVVISTDNGLTWNKSNALKLWDNEGSPNVFNNIATAGEKVVIDLSDYSGVVKFGFYAESLINNVENYLFVDNFKVTEIPAIIPDYTQDFSTFIPDRWTQAEGILAEPSTLLDVSTDWMQQEFANTGTDQSAKISVKLMFIKDWLISPSINLGDGSTPYQLEFDLALTAPDDPGAASTGGIDDKFAVVISTDNGVTWNKSNALKLWDNEGSPNVFNNIATAGEKVVIDLSDYTGIVKFGLYAESLTMNDENNLFVDNFSITEIPPIVPDYTQDFSSFIPEGWTQAEGVLAEPSTLLDNSTDWMQQEFANAGTDQSAKISVKLMFIRDWLISPSIDLGDGSMPYQLEFDLALTAPDNPGAASTGGTDDRFAVVISTDNGLTWNESNTLKLWDNDASPNVFNNISTTGEKVIIDLAEYTGVVKFGLYAESLTMNVENNLFIDNFTIKGSVSCPQPTGLNASNITATTADLEWTGGSSFSNIEYGLKGFTPGEGTLITEVATNPYSLTGLTPGTDYAFYVQDSCGENDLSEWSGPFEFLTDCPEYYSPIYNQGFESFVPNCWELAEGLLTENTMLAGEFYDWRSGADYADFIGGDPESAFASISGEFVKDWLISPSIDLETDAKNYQVEFKLSARAKEGNFPDGTDDKFAIVISTDNGVSWKLSNALRIWDNANSDFVFNNIQEKGEKVIINLSEYSGIVKFGLYVESTENNAYNYLWVDDFSVKEVPSCPEPTVLKATNITSNSASLSWQTGLSTNWNLEWSEAGSGFSQGNGTTVELDVTNPFLLENLKGGTEYQFFVQDSCGEGNVSLWAGPYFFTTECPDNFTPDYAQRFDSYLPKCWSEQKGLLEETTTLDNETESNWMGSPDFAYSGSGNSATIEIYGSNTKEWLISPSIDLGNNSNHVLEFDLALTAYGDQIDPETDGTDDKFAVVISTDNGATWSLSNAIATWDNSGSSYVFNDIPKEGIKVSLDLSAYSGIVKFGLYAESTVYNADNELFIDNFSVNYYHAEVSADITEACAGTEVQLNADVFNGSGSYEYAWTSMPEGFTSSIQNPTATPELTTTYYCEVTDGDNSSIDSITITIQTPEVTLANFVDVCADAENVMLTGGMPEGGVYSGTNVSDGYLNIADAGVGTHTITYTYTNEFGCTSYDENSITINELPTVTLANFADVCANAESVMLTGGLPEGGVYSGTNVSDGYLNITDAGVGTHAITYTYTNENGCIGNAENSITVNDLPDVSLVFTDSVCVQLNSYTLTQGLPAGGTYSGNNVTDGVFNPAEAGIGTHTITYTYVDENGCENSTQADINVDACLGINDNYANISIEVYPNPNNGIFNLAIGSANVNANVKIIDQIGNTIFIKNNIELNNGYTTEINLEMYAKGMYFVHINTNESISVQKVIIK